MFVVLKLCAKRNCREIIRDQGTYLILRELHKWEPNMELKLACENLVDILIKLAYFMIIIYLYYNKLETLRLGTNFSVCIIQFGFLTTNVEFRVLICHVILQLCNDKNACLNNKIGMKTVDLK